VKHGLSLSRPKQVVSNETEFCPATKGNDTHVCKTGDILFVQDVGSHKILKY